MSIEKLYEDVQDIIEKARKKIYQIANVSMVRSYWNIGRLMIEEEQNGAGRAAYGKGYNKTNLWYMRQFYQVFENPHALRGELSWTHYRLLLKIEDKAARSFYMEEAASGNWNTRTLERQINSLYYERMLMGGNQGRQEIRAEAESKKVAMQPVDIIKDPYVLDFLGVKQKYKAASIFTLTLFSNIAYICRRKRN